ncbi:MAG: NAD-dependent epimerase/dehydratase [Candidatus Eremiobacteraeota bacterium]|nr:NAD-dependent epimerase/dehydratase [Candidatus Eremiobacteraeota bacterium]
MRCVVTGCAGFVGSLLTDRLLRDGHTVVGIDNMSTGREDFLGAARRSPAFAFHRVDLLDTEALPDLVRGADIVFHLAANADVRFGTDHPTRDFEQNARATLNVLEAMRTGGVKKIAFSSTGSIYGEAREIPTPEFTAIPVQTSLYGASKIAAESFIEAYCEGFGMQAWIFRFVSLMGERYTHGHVVDFVRQLRTHPDRLDVLGDGTQRKSYLYVDDCIEAIVTALERADAKVNVLNLGHDEYCTVNDSIGWICARLGVQPKLVYSGGNRGWIGDNPFIFLDCSAMRALGWAPTLTIRESVERTVDYLRESEPALR